MSARTTVLTAIDIAIALTTLASRAAQAASEVQAAIARAREEGRDLTREELEAARTRRLQLEAEWRALAPEEGTDAADR